MPTAGIIARSLRAIVLAVSFVALVRGTGEASPAAGVVISNTATATYSGTSGTYAAQSNTLATLVAAVAALVVSPKESAVDPATDTYPVKSTITRDFTITNTGNLPDAYTVVSAAPSSSGATVTNLRFLGSGGASAITLNRTVSPTLQPGASITVEVTLATTGAPVGTPWSVALVARSTNTAAGNGLATDDGRTWALAQPAASLAGPGGPNTAVAKLVDGRRTHAASPGDTVTYSISFRNYGGSPATGVVITDDVPPGMTALPATVAINGRGAAGQTSLNGQRLTVAAGTLAVGAADVLTFDAVVGSGATAGSSSVNVASVGADGIASTPTTPASVFVGLSNVVYDGYAGAAAPVNGATLTLLDAATHLPVPLPHTPAPAAVAHAPLDALVGTTAGLPPNTTNANPFVTGADGAYSFVFAPNQLGTAGAPARYELRITAPGFLERRIGIAISPDASGLLYNATLRPLDDQDLARPGGFELVASSVSLSEVFGLLGNLPLFAPHPVAVTKSVDRDVASGGDRLLYTITVGDQGSPLGATRVVDTLPAGVVYAPGTARVDGVAGEPQRDGRVLTWTFGTLAAQHTITYACVVLPFAADGTTLVNVVDVEAAAANGTRVQASASADTRIVAGPLGNRIVITGRVFIDARKTGRFRDGDSGVAGVRVYLEDGESVTTDAHGRFTFPAVHPGQHVLRVDAGTLPATVRAFADRRYDSPRSLQRLVHGLYDAGLMHDVEFAVEPAA